MSFACSTTSLLCVEEETIIIADENQQTADKKTQKEKIATRFSIKIKEEETMTYISR